MGFNSAFKGLKPNYPADKHATLTVLHNFVTFKKVLVST